MISNYSQVFARRILELAGFLFGMAALFSAPAWAAVSGGTDFYSVCNRALPLADSFADECVKNARTQTRTFYPSGHGPGQPETHSIWFANNSPDSHFGLGCTLGVGRAVTYVGIYYTTHPENWKIANTADIRFIDFMDNAGVTVNGEPVTFVAVRQFDGQKYPMRFPEESAKNCEPAVDKDGWIQTLQTELKTYETYTDDKLFIKACMWSKDDDPGSCETNEYIQFFGKFSSLILVNHAFHFFLIKEDGGLLIDRKFFERSCSQVSYARRIENPNMAQELCHETPLTIPSNPKP